MLRPWPVIIAIPYLFEGRGEVVEIRGDYAQIKFPVPTPTVWLRLDQLEIAK